MLKNAMKSHAQYCPVARAADILNQKWTLLIFRDLFAGATRFNELRRGVPRMSPTLLSQRLRQLESQGLIERRVAPETGVIEYLPTSAGLEVKPIVELYGMWGQRWVRNRLGEDELDVSLLMWALRGGIERRYFEGERTVVRFEFTDRPRLKKQNWWLDKWWLIVTPEEIDLCIQDPGHEVDLYVISDLRTMTKVSMGDIPVRQAVSSEAIKLHGSRLLAKNIERWLPHSRFAKVTQPPELPNLEHFLGMRNSERT